MTKRYSGLVGINRGEQETSPGIFEQVIDDVEVVGELISISLSHRDHDLSDTIRARHILSIITPESDAITFNEAVYVVWQQRKWSVTAISYERPRVKLTLGGLYNE